MRRFFAYQSANELLLRRLVLAPPSGGTHLVLLRHVPTGPLSSSSSSTGPSSFPTGPMSSSSSANAARRRARARTRVRSPLDGELVPTVGSVFGCTLSNIVSYLSGRGVACERAAILRSLRRFLVPAARATSLMRGDDQPHLARGLAACRVVHAQRQFLRELNGAKRLKLDSKYGNTGTAFGATASLLGCFHVLSERPCDCAHLATDGSIVKVLRASCETLQEWLMRVGLDDNHWTALRVEFRCARRAWLAARRVQRAQLAQRASEAAEAAEAAELVRTQLSAALHAAYPIADVCEQTQMQLCECIDTGRTPPLPSLTAVQGPATAAAGEGAIAVIPLSELEGDGLGLLEARTRDGWMGSGASTISHMSSSASSSASSSSNASSIASSNASSRGSKRVLDDVCDSLSMC